MTLLNKKTYTPEQLASKHNVDISLINNQLQMGIKEEQEHTSDLKVAKEIALDHLLEDPRYYTKLKSVISSEQSSDKNLIFLDTEFYENGETIELISLGAVKPDGEQFYLVNRDFDYDAMVADATNRGNTETIKFLDENVFNNLNSTKQNTMPKHIIADLFHTFCGNTPTLWAATASYDWVVIMQMYGIMIEHPDTWPFLPMDTAQLKVMFPSVKKDFSLLPWHMPKSGEHNALFDACETYVKYLSYKKYFEDNKLPINI